MSDKEIKECEFYQGEMGCKNSCGNYDENCEDIENCATKQLLQKEQECEKLIIADGILNSENQKQYEKIQELKKYIKPFKDDYFKGLSYEAIAELAKKSIRLGKENGELRDKIDFNQKTFNYRLRSSSSQIRQLHKENTTLKLEFHKYLTKIKALQKQVDELEEELKSSKELGKHFAKKCDLQDINCNAQECEKLKKLQAKNGNLLMQCAYDRKEYEELNQNWYNIRKNLVEASNRVQDLEKILDFIGGIFDLTNEDGMEIYNKVDELKKTQNTLLSEKQILLDGLEKLEKENQNLFNLLAEIHNHFSWKLENKTTSERMYMNSCSEKLHESINLKNKRKQIIERVKNESSN